MKFNTLNTIISDIMETIRNGHVAQSENISRLQVEQWIHTYRALLLKQDIDKDGDINPQYIQYMDGVSLDLIQESKIGDRSTGSHMLETSIELPKLLDLNHRSGLVSIMDMYGNAIQLGSRSKAKYQTSRKYTCNDYIAFIRGKKLRIEGPDLIEYVNLGVIAENPSEVEKICGSYDQPYPIPADKIPVLKELIFQKELGIRLNVLSDTSNNGKDDLVYEGNRQKVSS